MSEQENQENQEMKERNTRGGTPESVYQDNEDALNSPPDRDRVGVQQGEKTPTYAPTSSPSDLDTNNPPAGIHVSGTDKGEETRSQEGHPTRYDAGTSGQAQRPVGKSTAADSTGINPDDAEPVDPRSPTMPPA